MVGVEKMNIVNNHWLNQLPKDWQTFPLKRVTELRSNRVSGTSHDEGYIGLENIESWTGKLLESSETYIANSDDEKEGMVSYFEPGDLLFGKLRPYLAKAYLAQASGTCTTELIVLKPSKIDGRYLLRTLLTSEFISEVDSTTFGARMPRADWKTIGNLLIPVPPLSKQRTIADYLDRETARIDALITAKERLLEVLDEKRRAVVTHAVTRGLNPDVPMLDSGVEWLGKIPSHWEVASLRRVLSNMDYGISESVNFQGNVAVLRMGDISDGEISYNNVGFIDEVEPSFLLNPGDLLFNRTNSLALVGKVGIFRGQVSYPVSFASYLVRLRCKNSMNPEFLNYQLNSAPVLSWANNEALPSIGQANLNPNRYSYLPIAIPPLREQELIADFLNSERKRFDELTKVANKTIQLLHERRTVLISAAVSGKLKVIG